MASVTNSNAVKYRHLGLDEVGPEKARAETLRDKILKSYLRKQLRTDETLEQHYKSQKDFSKASVEESITASISGLTSFKDFKKVQDSVAVKQVLRSSGLSEEDIKLLINEGEESALEAPLAREERLKAIKEKLDSQEQKLDGLWMKSEQFSGAVPLNRHDFEEEINTLPTTETADKLTACLVRLQPHADESIPADHPINHIKEIAESLFPSEINNSRDQDESKKRKSSWLSSEEHCKKSSKDEVRHIYLTQKPKTFWDMKEIPKIIGSSKPNSDIAGFVRSGSTAGKSKLYIKKKVKVNKHDPSKPFVLMLDDADLIPLEVIKSNRKTLEELRNMDKLKNVREGEPSETLYIKNLSHKVVPKDLASLMGHFESKSGPKIQYRLLNGRMRGQAFVTFQDKTTAVMAMETCNGFVLHEKPIVMEYSKR